MVQPWFPPLEPFILPEGPFDALLAAYGVRLLWRKSHMCPCSWNPTIPGSPDPACQTCGGRGVYWDAPVGPFTGLITWRHFSPTPDEFGARTHEVAGQLQHGEPTLTIPYTADTTGTIWRDASQFDAFVELDMVDRFSANLVVGGVQAVPYQQGLTVPVSGAVTTYDLTTKQVSSVSGYVVSGAAVTLPASYPAETPYTVEFFANPVFVAYRPAGGFAMARPFGNGVNHLPRRYRLQTLDLWTRARVYPNDPSPQGV